MASLQTPVTVSSSGEQVFDVDFHPSADIIAVGSISGLVEVFHASGEESSTRKLTEVKCHESSCRGVQFSYDGTKLYTISSDKSWKALDGSGKVVTEFQQAHNNPINKLLVVPDSDYLVTGDDSGEVKLWDTRTRCSPMRWKLHEDFVAGFSRQNDTILSVAGDATLCAYDLRKQSNCFRSCDQEAELHCVEVIKDGRKVLAGTQDGVILIFSWDQWNDCSDRYPGHPETVDCMLKIDDSTIFTGSSDGLIRVVAIQPNKILGVIGDHEEFPVEGMKKNRNSRLLASYSHDEVVRFWDISMFSEDVDGDNEEDGQGSTSKKSMETRADSQVENESDDGDWEDAEGDDVEKESEGGQNDEVGVNMEDGSSEDNGDGDDDDDDDENAPTNGSSRFGRMPTAAEKFFSDL